MSKLFHFSRYAQAPALALIVILGLLLLARQINQSVTEPQQPVMVREISLSAPPPPPPPPPESQQRQQDAKPNIQLSVDGGGAEIQFSDVKLEQEIAVETPPVPELHTDNANILTNLNFDWQAFGLSELDEIPRLLSQLKVKFPASLKRRGIKVVEVELDVVINEKGAVVLRRVIRNQYPELDKPIKRLIHQARFSVPKKDGVPVRAAFNWPVEFADS